MDFFIGQITLFPYNFVPSGWALCDGKNLKVAQNQALFSLLGHRFGGDGMLEFGLPNLMGKEPVPNMMYCICLSGIYPTRD